MPRLRFAFSEEKALEALAFIADTSSGLTPLFVAKILFYAEKWHINKYGRPIIADTYIAMPKGPVPSTVRNYIEQNWFWVDRPDDLDNAISIDRSGRLPQLRKGTRNADLSILSESDIECLREAIAFCKARTSDELSQLAHQEKAWRNAPTNGPMEYEDFIDDNNPNKDEIFEIASENAACGIL
jgi:uncharacterized phage-associated protein